MKQLRKIGVSFLATMGLAVPFYIGMPGSTAMAEIVFTNCDEFTCTPDPDQTFEIILNANVDGTEVGDADNDGLLDLYTVVTLTFHQAYQVTDGALDYTAGDDADYNLWVFSADIEVFMDTDVIQEARVSAFGFDTGGFCSTAVHPITGCADEFDTDDNLLGVGSSDGDYDTRVVLDGDDAIFDYNPFFLDAPLAGDWSSDVVYEEDREGSFPNQFGDIDVCFTMGNSCQGGQVGGVWGSATSADFTFVLAFADSLATNPSIALSSYGIRYQSVTSSWYGWDEDSGTGTRIPEPGSLMLMGMGLLGLGVARRRRQKVVAKEISN